MINLLKSAIKYSPRVQWLIREVRLRFGKYPEPEMKIVRNFLDVKRGVAIDVGAHVGGYTHLFLRLNCPVMAFEANPVMAARIQRLFPKAVVKNVAVSSTSGTVKLRIPIKNARDSNGTATIDQHNSLNGVPVEEIEIPSVTLDEAIPSGLQVGFLKIDVEGHELEVLQGASILLQRHHPIILVEAEERHRPNAVRSIVDFLLPFGYGGYMIDHDNIADIALFNPDHDQALSHELIPQLNMGRYKGRYINNFLFMDSTAARRL